MKQAARWLVNNLPLMAMALILAVLAWFVALEEADPTIEQLFPPTIPVIVTGLSEDLIIVGAFEERVYVTVQTAQSVWETLSVEDFDATVDLSGLEPGVYEVPVEVDLDREPSRITDVEPEVVTVELESRESRSVPVRLQTEGSPAVGYVVRAEEVEPQEVIVEGPNSYVTRVADVFAAMSIQGAEGGVEERLAVRPRDAEGNSVPYVSLVPENVDVRVDIEPTGYHAALAVRAVLTGEVASGYRITDISITPPTVTVFGRPEVLEALEQGFVETKPIAVEGATGDVIVRPGFSPPPQVTVVPGVRLQVHVFVEPIESSMTITVTPEIQGLGQGYTVTVSPDTVEVILSGPLPRLDSLKADDVRIVLDLFELSMGTHQLEPEVITPQEITSQGVIPATVQVRIAEIVDPTPTPDVSRMAPTRMVVMKADRQ